MRTKKLSIAVLLALLCLAPLCALVWGTGNDMFSMGLSENDDDQLTWSGFLSHDFGHYSVTAEILSFTDRGSHFDGRFSQGRFDLFDIFGSARTTFFTDYPFTFTAEGSLGVSLFGNFGGEFGQNLIHRMFGLPGVELPYEEGYEFHPYVGADLLGRYDISTMMNVFAGSSFKWDGRFRSLSFRLGTEATARDSGFGVFFDWKWVWHDHDVISRLQAEKETGLGLNMHLWCSFLSFDYRVNLLTGRGYGKYAFDILKLFEHTWKSSQIYYEYSFLLMGDGIMYDMVGVRVNASKLLAVGMKVFYTGGYHPKGNAITDHWRIRRNYGGWLGNFSIRHNFGWVEPYADLSVGISHWVIDKMTNIDPLGKDDPDRLANDWYPFLSVRAGVNLFPEGFLVLGSSTVRLDVFGGVMVFPKEFAQTLKKDMFHDDWTPTSIIPYAGVGIVLGF